MDVLRIGTTSHTYRDDIQLHRHMGYGSNSEVSAVVAGIIFFGRMNRGLLGMLAIQNLCRAHDSRHGLAAFIFNNGD